jgi:hypothetical protein
VETGSGITEDENGIPGLEMSPGIFYLKKNISFTTEDTEDC